MSDRHDALARSYADACTARLELSRTLDRVRDVALHPAVFDMLPAEHAQRAIIESREAAKVRQQASALAIALDRLANDLRVLAQRKGGPDASV